MRRRPLPRPAALVSMLVLAAVATATAGCDVWGAPGWAAKVGGEEISIEELDEFVTVAGEAQAEAAAQAAEQQGLPAETTTTLPGRRAGNTERDALGQLLQWELAVRALDGLDEDIADEARQQAEQQLGEVQIEGDLRDRVIDGLAATLTLGAIIGDHLDDPLVAELVDDFYDAQEEAQPGYWEGWMCIEGLSVPAEATAEVQGRIDDGESLPEILESAPEGVGSPYQSGESSACLPPSELPPDFLASIEAVPAGELVVHEAASQTGETVTYFLRVTDTRDIERDDEQVQLLVGSALQSQQGQQLLNRYLSRVAEQVGVEILPTIGSEFDVDQFIVVPPPFPLPPQVDRTQVDLEGGTEDELLLEP